MFRLITAKYNFKPSTGKLQPVINFVAIAHAVRVVRKGYYKKLLCVHS